MLEFFMNKGGTFRLILRLKQMGTCVPLHLLTFDKYPDIMK